VRLRSALQAIVEVRVHRGIFGVGSHSVGCATDFVDLSVGVECQ
jgi:hypothetical protein